MVSGDGARAFGGRWNPPGMAVVYASENLSLATLEILVHAHKATVLPKYSYLRLDVDDDALTRLDPNSVGDQPFDTVGGALLSKGLGFIVPSAVLSAEDNVVLNPLHPTWGNAVSFADPVALPIDPRLLQR